MKIIYISSEKLIHCSLWISSFCSLKYNTGIFTIQIFDSDKRKASQRSRFHKLTVLKLPAHRHELLIQLLDSFLIEIPLYFWHYICKFFFFSLPVKHLFSWFHFIFSDFSADFHPFFIKLCYFIINFIKCFSQFSKRCHFFSSDAPKFFFSQQYSIFFFQNLHVYKINDKLR